MLPRFPSITHSKNNNLYVRTNWPLAWLKDVSKRLAGREVRWWLTLLYLSSIEVASHSRIAGCRETYFGGGFVCGKLVEADVLFPSPEPSIRREIPSCRYDVVVFLREEGLLFHFLECSCEFGGLFLKDLPTRVGHIFEVWFLVIEVYGWFLTEWVFGYVLLVIIIQLNKELLSKLISIKVRDTYKNRKVTEGITTFSIFLLNNWSHIFKSWRIDKNHHTQPPTARSYPVIVWLCSWATLLYRCHLSHPIPYACCSHFYHWNLCLECR